jgi:hypothetical protein
MGSLRICRWLGAALLIVIGCQNTEPSLKPKLKREYVVPPADDSRFSSPPTYPKETLDTGQFKKDLERGKPPDPNKDNLPSFGMGKGPNGGY